MDPATINNMILMLVPFALSLTIHEFAHARTALAFGDPTAARMGRCSLNPLKHLDLMGTICALVAGFGWAKPVPVNSYNLHPRRLGDIMVSLAGPASNLALAVVCGLAIRLALTLHVDLFSTPNREMVLDLLIGTMAFNVMLAVFNMIPLYPLDGHHILREHLPVHMQEGFMQWQRHFGVPILLALVFLPRVAGLLKIPAVNPLGFVYGHVMSLAYAIIIPR